LPSRGGGVHNLTIQLFFRGGGGAGDPWTYGSDIDDMINIAVVSMQHAFLQSNPQFAPDQYCRFYATHVCAKQPAVCSTYIKFPSLSIAAAPAPAIGLPVLHHVPKSIKMYRAVLRFL